MDELMRAYEDDCKKDPTLQSFDTDLKKRAEAVISNLGDGGGGLSDHVLTETISAICFWSQMITDTVLYAEEEIVKLMADDKECLNLMDNYFRITFEMLDLCSELNKFLIDSRTSHSYIHYVIGQLERDYDIEMENETDDDYNLRIWWKRIVAACDKYLLRSTIKRNRYMRILEVLTNLKSSDMVVGNHCVDSLLQKAKCLEEKYKKMLDALDRHKDKAGKKLKNTRTWKNITHMIFMGGVVVLGICGVLAITASLCGAPLVALAGAGVVAGVKIGPVVAAVAAKPHLLLGAGAALKSAIPGLLVGKHWARSMFEKAENNIENQREFIKCMEGGARVAIKELGEIQVLINNLVHYMDLFVKTGRFAIEKGDHYSVGFAMKVIKDNLGNFLKKIEELEEAAGKCTSQILENRKLVLKKLTNKVETVDSYVSPEKGPIKHNFIRYYPPVGNWFELNICVNKSFVR